VLSRDMKLPNHLCVIMRLRMSEVLYLPPYPICRHVKTEIFTCYFLHFAVLVGLRPVFDPALGCGAAGFGTDRRHKTPSRQISYPHDLGDDYRR